MPQDNAGDHSTRSMQPPQAHRRLPHQQHCTRLPSPTSCVSMSMSTSSGVAVRSTLETLGETLGDCGSVVMWKSQSEAGV